MKSGPRRLPDKSGRTLRKFGAAPKIRRLSLRRKTQFLDPGFKRSWLDIKKRRGSVGPTNAPIALFDRLKNDCALRLIKRTRHRLDGNGAERSMSELDAETGAVTKDHGAFYHVAQLANIAWPMVRLKCGHGFVRNFIDPLSH